MYYWLPWEQKHNGKGTQYQRFVIVCMYVPLSFILIMTLIVGLAVWCDLIVTYVNVCPTIM